MKAKIILLVITFVVEHFNFLFILLPFNITSFLWRQQIIAFIENKEIKLVTKIFNFHNCNF